MPTIAEVLAAKAVASKLGAAASAAKKPLPFPSAGLRTTPEVVATVSIEPTAEILLRSLCTTSGEDVSRMPYSANPQEVVWHSALQGLNTELCVIQDPDPRNERAWMAIRRHDDPTRPLYLFSLPSFLAIGSQPEPF